MLESLLAINQMLPSSMALGALVVLFASFVQAVSGFGYALIATPLLTLVFGTKSVVVMNNFLAPITNVIILFSLRKHINWVRSGLLSLGGAFGVPLGALVLSKLDPETIKLTIAILVIPFSILLLLGFSYHFKWDRLGCSIAGFAGGVLGASTSLSGPPVVFFLLNQGLVTERFAATLAVFFLFTSMLSVGVFSSLGLVTSDLLSTVAVLLPALLLGIFAGVRMLPHIQPKVFKRIASAVISFTDEPSLNWAWLLPMGFINEVSLFHCV